LGGSKGRARVDLTKSTYVYKIKIKTRETGISHSVVGGKKGDMGMRVE